VSKTTETKDGVKLTKFVFHELQTKKNDAPLADTREATGSIRVEIKVKSSDIGSFESYIYGFDEINIEEVKWVSQFDIKIRDYTPKDGSTCTFCTPAPCSNYCCNKTCKYILDQFGVTPSNEVCIAELAIPDDYYNIVSTSSFETGLSILENAIKPKNKGGSPIMVGVYYKPDKAIDYINRCPASLHYFVLVGKGYDPIKNQNYYRFFDPGRSEESDGANPENRLYVDPNSKTISGTYNGKKYTVVEIRRN
jgi:hypothetical protein